MINVSLVVVVLEDDLFPPVVVEEDNVCFVVTILLEMVGIELTPIGSVLEKQRLIMIKYINKDIVRTCSLREEDSARVFR